MTSVAAVLTTICRLIKERAGVTAVVGGTARATRIAVWPWQLVPSVAQGVPPPLRPPATEPGAPPIRELELRVLLVCSGTPVAIDALTRAHHVLVDNPVLNVDNAKVQIVAAPLSAVELTALFSAAQVPLRLSASFTLRLSAQANA